MNKFQLVLFYTLRTYLECNECLRGIVNLEELAQKPDSGFFVKTNVIKTMTLICQLKGYRVLHEELE